jgi:hypothetical protein
MKEKLTRERIRNYCYPFTTACESLADTIFSAIESDREAVREETREEMRKDHFKIGERLQVNASSWKDGTVSFHSDSGFFIIEPPETGFLYRRLPKMRSMTRDEKIRLCKENGHFPSLHLIWNDLKDETIDDLFRACGLSTEVPTE